MKTVDLRDVKNTVEAIRSDEYQSIPSALTNEILQIEERYVESESKALSKVRAAVEESLNKEAK